MKANKIIDADRLIAEIERLNSLVPYENNDRHDEGLHDAYKAVKNIIDSLLHEEPLTPEERMNHPLYLEGFDVGRQVGEEVMRPKEWREEDEEMLNSCISSIEESKENRYACRENDGDTSYDREIAFLKSLPERFNLQPKQEWSEKDIINIQEPK